MKWRMTVGIVIPFILVLLTVPSAVTTQLAEGTVTIGYLGNASPALEIDLIDAFRGTARVSVILPETSWHRSMRGSRRALTPRYCKKPRRCSMSWEDNTSLLHSPHADTPTLD